MVDEDADTAPDSDIGTMFEQFAVTSARRAPLYAALSTGIAQTPRLADLLHHAPRTQRLPVLLFAVIHHLVLESPGSDLAQWYPNIVDAPRSPDDPDLMGALSDFVADRRNAIEHLLATRSTQTNEVGRCALLVAAFAQLMPEVGPLGHLDVGTSAGLTLLSDRYDYRFRSTDDGSVTEVGGPSTVVIEAGTSGAAPHPTSLPTIRDRLGIDRSPIDVTDPESARWLEACVWPDQADRFHRLVAALDIARRTPPEILTGDATMSLAVGIEQVGADAHPVVTNSWVLNYLTPVDRAAYVAELDRIGAERDLSWVYAESPAQTPELPMDPELVGSHLTVLSLARWRGGRRSVAHLATCHPHGYWLHWR